MPDMANWFTQVSVLTGRLLKNQVRQPFAALTNLIVSAFFFLIYLGALGGPTGIAGEAIGSNYTTFLLPTAILFATTSGSTSGLILVEDLESGYFRRLLTMPLSRSALVVAPMIVGALQVILQTSLILALGLLLGARAAVGFFGIVTVLLIAFVWGISLAGVAVIIALKTANAQVVQSASLSLFPLIFLSPAFLPRHDMQEWMSVLAAFNPTTYIIEGMRALLLDGWEMVPLSHALLVCMVACVVSLTMAAVSVRKTTVAK